MMTISEKIIYTNTAARVRGRIEYFRGIGLISDREYKVAIKKLENRIADELPLSVNAVL